MTKNQRTDLDHTPDDSACRATDNGVIDKRGPGRPTKFNGDICEQAMKLCLLGATDEQLADFFGVSPATLYVWKDAHPEFLEAITRGKLAADAEIAQALFHRAKGYEHDDIDVRVVNGEIVLTKICKHYPPDTQAASLWLRNRQPKLWRDKAEIGVTDRDGKDVAPIDRLEGARRIAFVLAQAVHVRAEST
jgi:hypothetical protein